MSGLMNEANYLVSDLDACFFSGTILSLNSETTDGHTLLDICEHFRIVVCSAFLVFLHKCLKGAVCKIFSG